MAHGLKTILQLAGYGVAIWVGAFWGLKDLVPVSDIAHGLGGSFVVTLTVIVGMVSALLSISKRTRSAGGAIGTLILMMWVGYLMVPVAADSAVSYLRAHPNAQRFLPFR
jgi:hypothetical protein